MLENRKITHFATSKASMIAQELNFSLVKKKLNRLKRRKGKKKISENPLNKNRLIPQHIWPLKNYVSILLNNSIPPRFDLNHFSKLNISLVYET